MLRFPFIRDPLHHAEGHSSKTDSITILDELTWEKVKFAANQIIIGGII